jgi:putative AdoMet-dependent methyltransferase
MTPPAWQWNEFQQVGTDYADAGEVERYDRRMAEFRDLPAENAAILEMLSLPEHASVLEIGTGTGHFARAAVAAGHRVTALDVSPAMLAYAQSRAKAEGLAGIEFRHAGFVTFSADPGAFDAAVSVAVLHHLPDVWKAFALENIYRMLKPGARLLLADVVFAWTGRDDHRQFDAFVDAVPESMRVESVRHIAQEYSTFQWIMEGLLTRAGFEILNIGTQRAPLVHYLCGRPERSSEGDRTACP